MLADEEIELEDDNMEDEELISSSRSKRPGPEDEMAPPAKRRKLHAYDADDATSTRTNDFGSPKDDLDVIMWIDEALEDQFSNVPPELMMLIFSFFDERTLMRFVVLQIPIEPVEFGIKIYTFSLKLSTNVDFYQQNKIFRSKPLLCDNRRFRVSWL